MKQRTILATFVCASLATTPAGAAAAPVTAVIDAGRTSAPINPNLYALPRNLALAPWSVTIYELPVK